MAHLSLHLLGPPQFTLAGEPVTEFESDKVRALLAYLAAEADRPHRRDALAGLLWPDWPGRAARKNLRTALSNLRRAIGDHRATAPFLLITRNTIEFNTASDHWLDVSAFTASVEADPPVVPQLEEALALYRGSFLEGFFLEDAIAFDDWSSLVRERLRRQALGALHHLAGHYERRGDSEQAQAYARRQVELEPWREEAHRQLMRLLALSGQRGAALAQYKTCRQLLAEELGVEPEQETKRLYEQIRDGELKRLPNGPAAAELSERKARAVGACPYRGLGAFREVDAPFFFGREDFSARLVEAVGGKPLAVVVVGSSGCGKSSTVFAGLLPRLREGDGWLIAPFRPGRRPFHALAAALLPLLEPELGETDRLIETRKLAGALREGEIPLYDAIQRALERRPSGARLLFVLDQFEELYTLCPEPELQHRFLDGLLVAVRAASEQHRPPLALLLTLRADFMGQALGHRPFADLLQDCSLMMGPMSRDELRRAIEKPAETQGAAFETGLVERVLDDVEEAPGNLPLLEFALTLLWEAQGDGWLTHAGYEEIGRVGGALARYADEVYGELEEGEQETARRIFVQLVRPGEGTEDTRRVATRAELGDEQWGLVQYLADRRLVVTGQDATERETVEVVHEALIQRWGQLRAWIDADRAFRTWQERLRAALWEWETSDRDEGALLRGAPLVQAEGWLAERGDELSEREREFIQASVGLWKRREVERERRRRRRILALGGGLIIATVLAILALNARATRLREASVNHSLVLASGAEQALESGHVDRALALAVEAVDMTDPPQEAVRVLSSVAYAPGTRAVLAGHSAAVRSVAISPDGRQALSGSCAEPGVGQYCRTGELILWDLEKGREARRFNAHEGWINAVAFSPDGGSVVSASVDGTMIVWNRSTWERVWRLAGHEAGITSVAFSPDGTHLLYASTGATTFLRDLTTGETVRHFSGHRGAVNRVRFSPDGLSAFSAGDDKLVIQWDVASGEEIRRFAGHDRAVTDVAVDPRGETILSVGEDLSLRRWEVATGEQTNQWGGVAPLTSVVITPEGNTALFSQAAALHMLDLGNWRESERLLGHTSPDAAAVINEIVVSSDGRLVLSAADDTMVRVWQLPWQRAFAAEKEIHAVAVSADGREVLIGGESAGVWEVGTGRRIRRLVGMEGIVTPGAIAFSPDGRYAAATVTESLWGGDVGAVMLWEVRSGAVRCRLEGHREGPRALAFSPDGRALLSGSQHYRTQTTDSSGDLILWDVSSCQLLRRFETTEDASSIAFSADGRQALVSGAFYYTKNVTLWDVERGQPLHRYPMPEKSTLSVVFGPEETTFVAGLLHGNLLELDLETGEVLRAFRGHAGNVWSVELSPDGRHLVSGSDAGEVILWDYASGQEISRFAGGPTIVHSVTFSPDGESVFFGAPEGSLYQWQVPKVTLPEVQQWVEANRYVRELTCAERAEYRVEPLCDAGVAAPGERRSGP